MPPWHLKAFQQKPSTQALLPAENRFVFNGFMPRRATLPNEALKTTSRIIGALFMRNDSLFSIF